MMSLRVFGELSVLALKNWLNDDAQRMGAALAFYTVFSLSPLLMIVIAVSGALFGKSVAQSQIMIQIGALIGHSGAQAVATMIKASQNPVSGTIATVIGLMTLLVGATGALI